MSEPLHADGWYETPNVDELRQEFQNAYRVIDSAIDGVNIDDYYTKTEIDNFLSAYYTSSEVDSLVTASALLTKILTVDGTGSGLDADLLDGNEAAAFALLSGATFTGDVTFDGGSAAATFSGGNYPDIRFESDLSTDVYSIFAGASNLTMRNVTSGINVFEALMGSGSEDIRVNGTPVIDYGSNSNGEYVRFYNGVQICWTYQLLTRASTSELNKVWTFPVSFNGNPRVVTTPANTGTNIDDNERQNSFLFVASVGSTSITLRMRSNGLYDSGDEHGVYAIAIGSWS